MKTDTIEAWREKWGEIGKSEKDRPWKYGALFNEGRKFIDAEKYEDEKSIARAVAALIPKIEESGLKLKTIRDFAYVDASIAPEARNPNLSWWHHREVWAAGVATSQQRKWLERAEKEGLSVVNLRRALATKSGGGERKEKAPKYDTSIGLVQPAGVIENALLKMFPENQEIRTSLLQSVRSELSGMVVQLKRVGIV